VKTVGGGGGGGNFLFIRLAPEGDETERMMESTRAAGYVLYVK
jgi:hypothetical protein